MLKRTLSLLLAACMIAYFPLSEVERAGAPVERLQLNGMPHGFGSRGGWIPAYDEWLEAVFTNN